MCGKGVMGVFPVNGWKWRLSLLCVASYAPADAPRGRTNADWSGETSVAIPAGRPHLLARSLASGRSGFGMPTAIVTRVSTLACCHIFYIFTFVLLNNKDIGK